MPSSKPAPPLTPTAAGHNPVRRAARAVLRWAVRRGGDRGGPWGEAVLAEFDEVTTDAEAVRWAAGGVWVSLRERSTGAGRWVVTAASWVTATWVRRATAGVLVVALLAAMAQQWVLTVVYVPSWSMSPTIDAGQRMLVDRVAYRVTGVDVGDVVVLNPVDRAWTMRVIGLPGDELTCLDGLVYRNGAALDEPYLPAGTYTECTPVTVPAGQVFLLGDHRDGAFDLRHDGPWRLDDITGRMVARLPN
ncbi:signal peptidase I [Micromonospora sp. LOL_014]|uniref:signal peptidase I n=1 Tax=Micromonospora sp. LOL_014 TaxID=3345415 RepID=UPI003A8451A0